MRYCRLHRRRFGLGGAAKVEVFTPYGTVGIASRIESQQDRRRHRFAFKMNLATDANRKHWTPSKRNTLKAIRLSRTRSKKSANSGKIKRMSFGMVLHADSEVVRLQSHLFDDPVARGPRLDLDSAGQPFECAW